MCCKAISHSVFADLWFLLLKLLTGDLEVVYLTASPRSCPTGLSSKELCFHCESTRRCCTPYMTTQPAVAQLHSPARKGAPLAFLRALRCASIPGDTHGCEGSSLLSLPFSTAITEKRSQRQNCQISSDAEIEFHLISEAITKHHLYEKLSRI